MNCSSCGKEISLDDNYCSRCGKRLNKSTNINILRKRVLFTFIISLMGITAYIAYGYMEEIGSTINLDDSNVPKVSIKADNCDSVFVENEVLTVFKKTDPYYHNFLQKTIDGLSIHSKEELSFSKDLNQYICKGIISVKSDANGFRPVNYDPNNWFYQRIYIDDDKSKIKKYTLYEVPVIYTSFVDNEKNYIEVNDFGTAEFSCKGACKPVYKNERRRNSEQSNSEPVQKYNEIEPNVNELSENNVIIETVNNNNSKNEVELTTKEKKHKFKLKFWKKK